MGCWSVSFNDDPLPLLHYGSAGRLAVDRGVVKQTAPSEGGDVAGRILWISQDILFWGSVRDAARAAGTEIVRADDDAAIETALGEGEVRRVIVDLEIRSIDANAAAARVAQSGKDIELIGYASHV